MAFYELEPWGPFRDNLHMARLAVLYGNAHVGKGQPFKIDDFMYKDPDTVHHEKQQEIASAFMAAAMEKSHDD